MSRLLIALYLDENVDILLVDLLRSRGFEATSTASCGRLSTSDPEQLAYAVSQERTLLTHNRGDFEALAATYREEGRKHYGVIITAQRPAREVMRKLLPLLDRLTADEVEDQLLYV